MHMRDLQCAHEEAMHVSQCSSSQQDAQSDSSQPSLSSRAEELVKQDSVTPPCAHNKWTRTSEVLPSPLLCLECIECGKEWVCVLDRFAKCRAFYRGKCTPGAECASPHVYARGVANVIKAGGPELTLREYRELVKALRQAFEANGVAVGRDAPRWKQLLAEECCHDSVVEKPMPPAERDAPTQRAYSPVQRNSIVGVFRHDPYSAAEPFVVMSKGC